MEFMHEDNRIYLNDNTCNFTDGGKLIAEVTFPSDSDNTVNINHTFVDDSLRGQGIAGKLMEAAALQIRASGKKAKPTCSYAVKWFEEHTEFSDIL